MTWSVASSARGYRGDVQRAGAPLCRHPAAHDVIALIDDERRDQHRQHHGGEHRVQHFGRDHAGEIGLCQQHEAEFAAGAECEAGPQRRGRVGAEHAHEPEHERALPGEQRREERDHPDVAHHLARVEQHADGNEKQPEQHVAERLDVLRDLIPVLRFGDECTGDEGAQRERQPGPFGEIRDAQRDEQHVEDEQFRRLALRHDVKPAAHQPLAGEKQQREHDRGLDEGEREVEQHLLARRRERRHDDEQRHDGEILREEYAEYVAAVRRVEFRALGEEPREHRRRRHRERHAECNAALPGETEQQCECQHRGDGRENLRHTEPEHDAAHRHEPWQAELEADREHEKHDADFRESRHDLGIVDETERVRADGDADDEIADQRRQSRDPAGNHHQHGGREQYQHGLERGMHEWRQRMTGIMPYR